MEIKAKKEEIEKLINDRVREAADIAREAVSLAQLETEIITTYSHMVGGDGISYYFGTSKERYDKFNFLKRVSEEITDRNHRRKMITARLDKLYIIL